HAMSPAAARSGSPPPVGTVVAVVELVVLLELVVVLLELVVVVVELVVVAALGVVVVVAAEPVTTTSWGAVDPVSRAARLVCVALVEVSATLSRPPAVTTEVT